MAYLAHLLSDIERHWLLAILAFVVVAAIVLTGIGMVRGRLRRRRVMAVAVAENLKAPASYAQASERVGFGKARRAGAFVLAGVVGLVLFGFLGSWLTVPLVNRYGETGEGLVTGQYRTADLYNNEPVIGFDVVIRKADGGIVRTGFRSDTFNVYPHGNRVRYPPVGARFNVRYLPVHPRDFVIVANDDSPWARSLRCGDLVAAAAATQRERAFAPDDRAAAERYARAVEQVRQGGCG